LSLDGWRAKPPPYFSDIQVRQDTSDRTSQTDREVTMKLIQFGGTVEQGLRDSKYGSFPFMLIKHEDRGTVFVDVLSELTGETLMTLRLLDKGDRVTVTGRPTDRTSSGKPVFKAASVVAIG